MKNIYRGIRTDFGVTKDDTAKVDLSPIELQDFRESSSNNKESTFFWNRQSASFQA